MAKKIPNPIVHALVVWLSHSSTWSLIFGVLISFVVILLPTWTGKEHLQDAFTLLGSLLAGFFAVLAGAQKFADGKTGGETSAYLNYLKLVEKAEREEAERAAMEEEEEEEELSDVTE